jgi:ferredoxin
MWFRSLSSKQQGLLFGSLVAAGLIVGGGWLLHAAPEPISMEAFTVDLSLREIARAVGVTGKSLARDLDLPIDVKKQVPLTTLGITQPQLARALEHLAAHRESTLKYHVFGALVLVGWVYLVRLGRPDGSPTRERKHWYPRWPYLAVLVVALLVCGFALGKSPNPMEGAVKVFKSMVGLYPSVLDKVLALAFFAALAVVGTKLVCGWACPLGALQELIYSLPMLRTLKQRKLPFVLSNGVRVALFVVGLLLLLGVVGGRQGFVLYHGINPFNLFNLDIDSVSIGVTIVVVTLLSMGVYRPFCQLVCPFGLLSWLLERISLFQVKIDHGRCTRCGACSLACPNHAAAGRVARKALPADCFSCGRCLKTCPQDAINYCWIGRRPGQEPEPAS